jgi:hypothetical protein
MEQRRLGIIVPSETRKPLGRRFTRRDAALYGRRRSYHPRHQQSQSIPMTFRLRRCSSSEVAVRQDHRQEAVEIADVDGPTCQNCSRLLAKSFAIRCPACLRGQSRWPRWCCQCKVRGQSAEQPCSRADFRSSRYGRRPVVHAARYHQAPSDAGKLVGQGHRD